MFLILLSIFILLCGVSAIEERLTNSARTGAFLVVGLVLALLAGFRPDDVDHDYMNYVGMYYESFAIDTEITFIVIASIVEMLFDNVVFVFVIYAFIGVFLHLYAIKRLTSLWFLSLLVYLSSFYLLHGMNQIRVGVSAGFFLLALHHLQERDKRRYVMCAILATLFHYTSVILFFFLLINDDLSTKWRRWLYMGIIPAAYLMYLANVNVWMAVPIPYFEEKLEAYQALQDYGDDVWSEINVFNLVLLVKIVIVYFIFWKRELIENYNKYVNILLKVEVLSIAAFVIFHSVPVVSMRINEFLGIVEVVLFPLLFYTVKPAWLGRVIVMLLAAVLLFISLFYNKTIMV